MIRDTYFCSKRNSVLKKNKEKVNSRIKKVKTHWRLVCQQSTSLTSVKLTSISVFLLFFCVKTRLDEINGGRSVELLSVHYDTAGLFSKSSFHFENALTAKTGLHCAATCHFTCHYIIFPPRSLNTNFSKTAVTKTLNKGLSFIFIFLLSPY